MCGLEQCGVWASGAHGHQHCREVLADTIEDNFRNQGGLVELLRMEMSDDAWEEIRALEMINEHLVEVGYELYFHEGDLGLWTVGY